MMLGPKITAYTKYGAKVGLRYSLLVWMFNRGLRGLVKKMCYSPWDNDDVLTFSSKGAWNTKVLRVRKDDCILLKLGWM